jgi:hypothetical protein
MAVFLEADLGSVSLDELASFQLIELHSVPVSQGQIGGYRIGEDQSGGTS